MAMRVIANINKGEEECARICEERTQIWTYLVEYPEMKVMEEKLRETQEKAQKELEIINTFPLVEQMTTILS
jgi:hypothetical protein